MIREYYEEIERAKQPGYVSRYDDFDFEYTDAPRSRPARFDQPHAYPCRAAAYRNEKYDRHEKRGSKPHFRSNIGADSTATPRRTSPAKDGFGAGIFPGQRGVFESERTRALA